MKKRSKIIIAVVVVIIIAFGLLVLWSSGGITKKGRFTKCMEVCYELMFMESSKQWCPEECTNETGFEPTSSELTEIIAEINNEEAEEENETEKKESTSNNNTSSAVNVNNAATNTNSSLNRNTNSSNVNAASEVDESADFYCEWSWPQKIIYRDTKEVVVACSSSRPWCDKADGTYDKVGCCTDQEHTDCTSLDNLLNK